jgi:hypothetical protein
MTVAPTRSEIFVTLISLFSRHFSLRRQAKALHHDISSISLPFPGVSAFPRSQVFHLFEEEPPPEPRVDLCDEQRPRL